MGSSYIFVGDDATPYSNSLTLATSQPFHDGGFIDLDQPVTGRYVVVRRIGPGITGGEFIIQEIKVYAVTNLLQYGATILQAPAPYQAIYSADNLIQNLRARSSEDDYYPIIDAAGNRST